MKEYIPNGPIDTLSLSFSRIAMWGPAFIVAIIFYEVVLRYVFFAPTLWVNEMSLWVAGAIYLTAGLYSMQQRSHIRIFILYDIAPLWLRRIFDVTSFICVLIFAFAVVWGGFGEATAKFFRWEKFGTAFDPPIPATIKPLILTLLLLLTLQACSNLVRDWPAVPWARKVFDIASTVIVLGLVGFIVQAIVLSPPDTMATPGLWIAGITVILLIAAGLVIYGLFRDFNRAPIPFEEGDDETDLASELAASQGSPDKQ